MKSFSDQLNEHISELMAQRRLRSAEILKDPHYAREDVKEIVQRDIEKFLGFAGIAATTAKNLQRYLDKGDASDESYAHMLACMEWTLRQMDEMRAMLTFGKAP